MCRRNRMQVCYFCKCVCVLHSVRENMKWAPALQRERGHASCFSPQRWSPEAGQRGRTVRGGLGGVCHSHNTSGICEETLHLSNEISFSNYNTPPIATHIFKSLTMVWPLESSFHPTFDTKLNKSITMLTALVRNNMPVQTIICKSAQATNCPWQLWISTMWMTHRELKPDRHLPEKVATIF